MTSNSNNFAVRLFRARTLFSFAVFRYSGFLIHISVTQASQLNRLQTTPHATDNRQQTTDNRQQTTDNDTTTQRHNDTTTQRHNDTTTQRHNDTTTQQLTDTNTNTPTNAQLTSNIQHATSRRMMYVCCFIAASLLRVDCVAASLPFRRVHSTSPSPLTHSLTHTQSAVRAPSQSVSQSVSTPKPHVMCYSLYSTEFGGWRFGRSWWRRLVVGWVGLDGLDECCRRLPFAVCRLPFAVCKFAVVKQRFDD